MSGKTKKASFMNLVYREFALGKSIMKLEIFVLGFFYLICFMVTLSSRFGNLANASNDIAAITPFFVITAKLYGIYVSFVLFFSSMDTVKFDIQNKAWLLFRKSLPASPAKLAAAKFTYLFLMFMLSIGLSFAYMGIDGIISGTGINRDDIMFLPAVASFVSVLCVCSILCMEFTKSYDMGNLMAFGVILLFIVILAVPNKAEIDAIKNNIDGIDIYAIVPILEKLSGFFIVSIILSFVLGFFFMTLIYRRREK